MVDELGGSEVVICAVVPERLSDNMVVTVDAGAHVDGRRIEPSSSKVSLALRKDSLLLSSTK